jgi:chromosome partitioning protein
MALTAELQRMPEPESPPLKKGHVIAFGNEKGGTGKTTTAMHIVVSLLKLGRKVAAIDLDSRQKSFGRYIENRGAFIERSGHKLAMPTLRVIDRSKAKHSEEATADEAARLDAVLAEAREDADFIVIDMPGSDTSLSRLGHAAADTLVTPMNDSFLDFDLLAKFDPESLEIKGPSVYSEFVWECRKRRVLKRAPAIDWVVVRNRVSALEARNKKRVAGALESLSTRIGFRVAPGLSERVIFRELFPLGLTLFDLPLPGVPVSLTMSHVSARQEIRELLGTLRLPGLG